MQDLFSISNETDFLEIAMATFWHQYKEVEPYQRFVNLLNRPLDKIKTLHQIPFLPIETYKNHCVIEKDCTPALYFQSSGTTQSTLSKHFIKDPELYKKSILKSFCQFIGSPQDFLFLGLLPSYLERKNASLIFMVDYLMATSGHSENNYFLYNHKELFTILEKNKDRKIVLFGVSFALLDFLDTLSLSSKKISENPNLIVIETGGMKGRKEEISKDELLLELKKGFATPNIFSEYSMTELLSQAYSLGDNSYTTPSWMKVMIRQTEDPFSYEKDGKTGAINIIDLANKHSCSFIATQDMGKVLPNSGGVFQVLGRLDHSDIRGCSLLVS